MANVKVAVRVRPLSKREQAEGRRIIVEVEDKVAKIRNIKVDNRYEALWDTREKVMSFGFDYCYWSVDPEDPKYASQEVVFQDLGTSVLSGAFKGYNICLFAYGQTGSGKTYTMMGTPASVGLTPRICQGLFAREDDYLKQPASCRVEVSFLEVYNERVRDLLRQPTHKKPYTLRVREHPETGPYVQGLSQHVVTDYRQVVRLLEEGIANRFHMDAKHDPEIPTLTSPGSRVFSGTQCHKFAGMKAVGKRITAVTHVHDASSRSHAIFTIQYTQAILENNLPSEIASKINLVDLAGSERADPSYCKDRITEGANINKSLVTLGIVISTLAQNSQMISSCQSVNSIPSDVDSSHTGSHCGASISGQRRQAYIPYRDSILTWLLKDSLGGNSKTIMIATISPASSCYNETMNTLRYASNAKNIINKPRVNEDANVKLIRELREEIDRLKAMLMSFELKNFSPSWSEDKDGNLTELVLQNELKIEQLTKDWTEKWINKKAIMEEYSVDINKKKSGVTIDSSLPHLMTMDEDILSTGVVLYHLRIQVYVNLHLKSNKEGTTKIGRCDSNQEQDIVLQGEWIEKDHCVIENRHGVVTLRPLQGAHCVVNGHKVTDSFRLSQGALVVLGKTHKFRFNHPAEAAILRQRRLVSETSPAVSCSSLEWLDLDGDFASLLSCNLYPAEKVGKQVAVVHEECCPKEKNEVRRSRKLQKQLLYVEELQQQILDGKIKAERELEHDQAVINQQTRENQQWLIHEKKRLSVQQQQESAVQTEAKSYAEAGVQNILELEICPSLIQQNKKKLVQLELLQKYSLKEAERNLRRKEVKLHLDRIVKKQKLLEAKKNLERLEAGCWISEDNVKHSHPLCQDTTITSWDCKYPKLGQASNGSSLQHRSFFLKRDTSNQLSTSAHSYRCSQVSPSKKSLSVEYLPGTVKELSRTDNVNVEIDNSSFPTPRQLTEIYKSLCLADKQRTDSSISNAQVISDICKNYYQMEKTDNRPRQIQPKAQISKSCSPDLFKKKGEPESRKQVARTKAIGDTRSCNGKHLEKNEDQEISKKKGKYVRNKHQGSLPASSVKELKKSAACRKLPVQYLNQTAKNGNKDLKDKQSEGHELLRSATSAGSLNKINNEKLSEKRWHSAEVLSVGISKTAPDTLRSLQEDEDIEFSDTDSTYSVDSLSCIYTTVMTEQVRQEESAGIQDTLDLEDSESDDSQMSRDSLTEKVNKPESQDQKCFSQAHQELIKFYKDNNCQPLSVLATTSTSDNRLTEHERSFSLDSLGDVDEVSEDMTEECKLESFDEVPAELFWGLQNPQLETRNRHEQHNPETRNENIIRKSDELNFSIGSFYLDASTQSGSSSICDQSLKEMKINFSVQGRSLDKRPCAPGENLPLSSDAWLSYELKSGKSSPIIAMPSFQDFQVAHVHPFNTSHSRTKKDELRQSAAELSFVSYKEPHRIAHESNLKTEILFSSAPPSTPLPETRKHLEKETVGASKSLVSSAEDVSFDHDSALTTKYSCCEIASLPESSNYEPDELTECGSTDEWEQTSSCLEKNSDKNNSSQASEKQDLAVSLVYPENNAVLKNNSLISTSSMHCLEGEEPHATTNLEDCIFRITEKDVTDYDCDGSIKDSKVVDSNTKDKFICSLSSEPPRLATVGATQEKYQCHENLFSKEKTLCNNESFYLCNIRSKCQNDIEEGEYSHDKIHLLRHDGFNFDLAQKISYQQVSEEDASIDSSAENKLYHMKTTASQNNNKFTPGLQTSAVEKATIHENRDVVKACSLEVPSFTEMEENNLGNEEWSSEKHFEFQTEALMNKSDSSFIPDCFENCSRQKGLLNLDAELLTRNSVDGKMDNMTCMDLVTDNVKCSNGNVNEKKDELSVLNSCSIDDKKCSQSNPNMLCHTTTRVEREVCETRSSDTKNNCSVNTADEKNTIHTILHNSVKFDCPDKIKVRHKSLPSSREVNEVSLLCMDLKKVYSGVELCTTQARNYTDSVKVLENRVFSDRASEAQTPSVNKESEYLKENAATAAVTLSGDDRSKHSNKSLCSEELTKLINSVNKLESDLLEIKSSQNKSLYNYLGMEIQSGLIVNRKNFESSSPFHRPSSDHENCERKLLVTVTQEEINKEKVQLNDNNKGELCALKTTTGPSITFQSSSSNENKIQENTEESECHTTDMKADSKRIDSAVYCSSTVLPKKTAHGPDQNKEPVQTKRVIKTACASVPTIISVPPESRQKDTSDCSKEHKKMPPNNDSKSCLTESLISPNAVFQENKVDENIINFETENEEQSDVSEKERFIGPRSAENNVLLQEKPAYDHMCCDSAAAEIPEKYFVASTLEEEDGLQLPITCLDISEIHREKSHAGVANKTLENNSNNGSLCEDRDVIGQCKISEDSGQADNFEDINAPITLCGNGLDVYKSVPVDFIPDKAKEMHLLSPVHLAMTEVLAQCSSNTQHMHIFKMEEEETYFKENSERAELEISQNQTEVLPENKGSYCFSNKETLLNEVSKESEWLPHIFSNNKDGIDNNSINVNQKDIQESINQSYKVTTISDKDLLCQPACSPLLTGKNTSGETILDDCTETGNSSVLFSRNTSDITALQYYEAQMDSDIQAGPLSTKGRRDDSDVVVQNKCINFPHELLEWDREMKADIRFTETSNYIRSEQVSSEDNPFSESHIAEYHGSLAFAPANDTVPLTKLSSENTSHDLGSSNEKHIAREDQKPEHYLQSVKNIPQKHAVLGSFGSKTINVFPSAIFKEDVEETIQCLPEFPSQENFNSINSQKVMDSLLQHDQTNKCLQNTNCTETECKTNSESNIGELGCQEKNEALVYRSSHNLCERDSEATSEAGEELLQHSTLWENANYHVDNFALCSVKSYVSEYSASLLNSSTLFPNVLLEHPRDKYEADGLNSGERKCMHSKVLNVKDDYDVCQKYNKSISNAESPKTQEIVEIYQKEKQEESSFPECSGKNKNHLYLQSENNVDRTEISLQERSSLTHQSLEQISNDEVMQTHLCSLKDFSMCTEFKNASISDSSGSPEDFTSSECMQSVDSLQDAFLTSNLSSALQESQEVCYQAFLEVSRSSSKASVSLSRCQSDTERPVVLNAATSSFPKLATSQMQESQCSDTVIFGQQPCALGTTSSFQRNTNSEDTEIHKSKLEKKPHEVNVCQTYSVKDPPQKHLKNTGLNSYPLSNSCPGSQRDQSTFFNSRVSTENKLTSEANTDCIKKCELLNKGREFLMSEHLNPSVINENMSSKYLSENNCLSLQKEPESEILGNKKIVFTAQNANISKDNEHHDLQSHSLSAPAITVMANFECASEISSKRDYCGHLASKSLQELNMSVEPPSPTEDDAHRTDSFLKFKTDSVVPVKHKPRFQKKSFQAQRSINCDKRNWRELSQSSHSSDPSFIHYPVAVDHTTHSPMGTDTGKCANNVPLVCGHNMDTEEPRSQIEASDGLLQHNKDVMHFSSSDINPYIHSWQQDERCKIGWKQYVFGSASDVSSNPPPLSLDTQTVMRCSSVDNGLNSENSPFHSHLSSYANARVLSSTISSTDDIQGWEIVREGFESTHSGESSKHCSNPSHDEHESTPEKCVSRCERSQQSGNTSMQVDEIVLLCPSESDVPCCKPKGHLTCEQETQTEPPVKHKRPKRHRRSYTDISARKPEGATSSFQQPSSWSSVQNLSMHLSQLLHNTSELLGNFSLHTVKANEQSDQKTKDKESAKVAVFDNYTQTTKDIGIQTDILRYPEHKNKENQINLKMEGEPMKSQEVNVIVKVVHTDTVALMKERVSDRKELMLQSMPDLRSHDDSEILEESHLSKTPFNKYSSSSLDMQEIPLAAVETVTLDNPESSLAQSYFHSQSDETSHMVISKPSSSISLSSACYSQDRKLVNKPGIPETNEVYCNNSLFVDRASSPILTLSASPASRQHSLNKSTSFEGSVANPRDTANVLTSFRKRESGPLYNSGSQDLHVDTSSQTDSESVISRDNKEVCKKSENVLDKNTAKELSGISASKEKKFTHTAIHTKRLYHSSSTLELSSHGEYSVDDHRESVPVEHSFHQIRATRTARNFSGGIKYESPMGNSESSPTTKSFQISLNELSRSSSLKSTESPECLLDSFSPQCHQTGRINKNYPCSASEISEMQGDDTIDAESDMESECNTEILLNENTSLVKTHRRCSYSLHDLPVHNKFSNWCGVKSGTHSSLTSLTRSTGDIQSLAERRTINTRAVEFQDRSLLGKRRTREIERLQRERAQIMSSIHLDMNQPPLTVELTEAKLNYGIGETDAQLRILQSGAGENFTSVPTKQQLYERHKKSVEILRKQREERLQCFRRSRSLSPQKHISLLQSADVNQRDSDLPSRRREYLQQLRRDVIENTRVHEPKMRIQHPSEIELLLRDYQKAREETKTEIARARDKLRERAEREKRRIQEQIFSQLHKEETKLKTLLSTSTLCTDSTLSLSSGPTSGYNSSNAATYAASILGKKEEQAFLEDAEHPRGRSAIRNHQVYILEQLQKNSTNETFRTASSCREKSSIQSPLPASQRFFHNIIVSPSTFPASPMKGYEDLSKYVLANATAEVMAVCSNDLRNLYSGQATAGWKYQCMEKDVLVYYKAFSSSATKHGFLGAGVIDRPLPTVLCMLKDPSKRHLYDKTITTAQVHKKITSSIELVYVVSDISLCYQKQPRDFCCISVEAKEENVSILAIQSVYEESMPRPCKEMIRGEILPSAWILEPDTLNGRDITKVIYMVQVDLGAPAIPASLLSSVAKRQPLVIARLAHFLAG